jgi:hypothetical protein
MIVPLKIAVWSLKLVKRLPGVENDSSVMNSPGSLNSPVMNTPGSRLLGVFGRIIRTGLQKNFMLTNRPGSQDSSNVLLPGESWLPDVFCTSKFLKNKFSRLLGDEYTGESITNTNNFLKIWKISKSFLGISKGKRKSCLMKKTRVKNLVTLSL